MRLKRKSCEKIYFYLSDHALKIIKESSKLDCDLKILEKLNHAEDGIVQINIFKEIQTVLLQKGKGQLSECQSDIMLLCYAFYQSPLKSSQKKTSSRILQELSNANSDLIINCLLLSLSEIMEVLLLSLSIQEIDRCTDCLLGVLDNFPIGIRVITSMNKTLWKYFSETLIYIVEHLKKSTCVEVFSTCQSVLKVFTTTLQHCENFISTDKSTGEDVPSYNDNIMSCLVYLLSSEYTVLNCRLNAGIALCYYKYSHDPDNSELNFFNMKDPSFEAEKFPPSSKLCIYSGIMAVLPSHKFVSSCDDKILAEEVFRKILLISDSIGDSDLLLLCARDLIQWSNIMNHVLCNKCRQPLSESRMNEVKKLFQEDSQVTDMIFQYILQYREHSVDTLRHLTKDLFKNVLNLHLLSLNFDVLPHQSPLLAKMAHYLLHDLPPYSQGKYGLLGCIANLVGTKVFFEWFPDLPDTLYMTLKEVSLVSHVSDLLEILFRKYDCKEIDEDFKSTWLKPLLKLLLTEPKEQSTSINEQVLPKLFKAQPNIVQFLLSELSKPWKETEGLKNEGNCFSALIVCVKFLQRQEPNRNTLEFISFESLVNALSHADDQVRLSALALICENPKTTEPVPADALKLIKLTLQYNISCQSPAFRQQLVALLKKLFNRMDKSRYTIERKKQLQELENEAKKVDKVSETNENCASNNKSSQVSVQDTYNEFLLWIKKFLYDSLIPGANFPRRVTALNLLSLLNSIFSKYFSVVSEQIEMETLFCALNDTYENNKITAVKLLLSCNPEFFESQNKSIAAALVENTLSVASSTKPPDTVTAAFKFALMVHYECFKQEFKKHITEQMEDGNYFKNVMEHPSFDIEASSGVFLAVLLLARELMRHLQVAELSLLNAAAHTPFYGVLACIRSVMAEVDFRHLDDSELPLWNCLIQELIDLSLKVASTVEPVVCNSSPEGHLPMDTDSENIEQLQSAVRRAIGSRFQSATVQSEPGPSTSQDGVVLDITKTRAVTAQILLLCCWRTHKEVSLLFGDMAERIPVSGGDGSHLLNVSQVLNIGEYFIRQMTLVKHKGAFEQAFIGFSQLCRMLWRSNIKVLTESPKEWLKDLFLAIQGQKDNMQLCSTRRSAGLPFIVQALLTSDPGLSNSSFFKSTITALLGMALAENGKQEEKIHALNILRALFRDALLSEVLIPFVSDGLKASIIGFKSKSWAVRNSSTLLFSALMIRIFGVNHTHDDAGKKNRLTGKTFFTYYKDMYLFLYNELEYCASVLSENQNSLSLVPALYPILLILGRLYPAPGDGDPRLSSFIPFLKICGSSAVWKVRVLTAKALVPLISAENVLSTLESLFDSLPNLKSKRFYQNEIHGIYLQVINILKEFHNLPQNTKDNIENTLPTRIISHFEEFYMYNNCNTTRAAYLDVILHTITRNISLEPLFVTLLKSIADDILHSTPQNEVHPDREHYLCLSTVLFLLILIQQKKTGLEVYVANINLKYKCLLDLLSSPYDIVKCTTLQVLVCRFQNEKEYDSVDMESTVFPVFFKNVFGKSVCSAIREADGRVFESFLDDQDFNEAMVKAILEKDVRPSCLGNMYLLLNQMPLATDFAWSLFTSLRTCLCRKLKCLLFQAKHSSRDDISNEMLLYATRTALKICHEVYKIEKDESRSLECFQCEVALRSWSNFIKSSVLPENCNSRRKAVISSLDLIFLPLSMIHCLAFVLDEDSAHFWQALASLLMDDEPEIKQLAADIVVSIKTHKNPNAPTIPVVPSLALDHLMEVFVNMDICDRETYICVFLNWMLDYKKPDAETVGDEQPFDPGELNVYAETLTLSKLARKHFRRYLIHTHCTDTPVRTEKIPCWQHLNDELLSFYEIPRVCMDEIEDLMNGICQDVPSRNSVVNRDCSLIRVCQRMYVLMCFSDFMTEEITEKAKEFFERIQGVKARTVYVDSVIRECVYYCL